ncbi:MAG TPA: isocitrate lyase/phosphoenolpyruvate mutase family protein [Acidimicrobiales bacterium]|jgi:2-methylisocitrate lyase-like PEP mutase family enzyme|nr:isocitrate lyase/phosphoenolpyruvate mutase family protein [Acidimicrobiales bacterium]
MTTAEEKRARFRAAHEAGNPLIMPNPWDRGSARLLQSIGFQALATTSSGFAATLGRLDYSVSRDEALGHAAGIVGAVDVPVSADLENCFADDPDGVATTVARAVEVGLAGCSVEDFTTVADDPIYELSLAAERVAAAAAASAGSGGSAGSAGGLVLTARAENYLNGRPDLDDTIRRLQAYQEAGADVLYAPGMVELDQIRSLVESVDRPVNVLLLPGCPSVAELASVGVGRISIGGAFAMVALEAVAAAGLALLEDGSADYLNSVGRARQIVRTALEG